VERRANTYPARPRASLVQVTEPRDYEFNAHGVDLD
jgi:hypothetical protein